MITISPELVAMLGCGAVMVLTFGVWYPRHVRERALRRRIASLATTTGAMTVDTGGRRRARLASARSRDTTGRVVAALEHRIEMAGLDITPSELFGSSVILAIIFGSLAFALAGPLAIAPLVVCGAALPLVFISWVRRRRRTAFVRQMPDTVALLASAVRAGHSLMQGFEQVAREALEPTRSALEQVVREIGLGAAHDEALERLAQRFPSQDLDLLVTSISVQQQVGGSLAETLDEMADTLRERDRVNREIDVLTSPQRYSAYVLALLPVLVAVTVYLISRDYMQALFEGTMRIVAAAAAMMALLGFLIMRRMATIDV